jgi:hypothetical protein
MLGAVMEMKGAETDAAAKLEQKKLPKLMDGAGRLRDAEGRAA